MPDDMQPGGQAPNTGTQGQDPNAAGQNQQQQQQQSSQAGAGNAANAQSSSQSTSQAGMDATNNQQATTQQQQPTLTLEQALDALKKARAEAASHRVKLNEFEEAQKTAELAKLDETERLRRQYADLQAQQATATLQAQERIVRAEVKAAATEAGIKPALAAKLIDFAAIEYDSDTGEPTNIGALLQQLSAEYPELKAATQSQQATQRTASTGAAVNAARSATQSGAGLTREIIEHMTPREHAQRRSEVMAWLAAHPNG